MCGGESTIQEYCISIARRAGALTAEILGTDVLDHPNSCMRECNFANVRLPLDFDAIKDREAVPEWMKTTGLRESGIYFQIVTYRGYWYWRLSGMIYLEEADYATGAHVLKDLCDRVKAEEHLSSRALRVRTESLISTDSSVAIHTPTSTTNSERNI